MPWLLDETTGSEVWQDPNSGKVQLKSRDGGIFQVNPEGVAAAIAGQGYSPAEPGEVAQYDRRKEQGIGSAILTGAEAGVAGAFDAATAPIRGPSALISGALGVEDPLGDVRGRQLTEDVVALAGGERAAQDYAQGARQRAEDMPGVAMGGRIVGEIASPLSKLSTLAKTGAGRVGATAVEGGLLGGAQEGEDAYIADREVKRDRVLAGMGLGAILGGTAAFGLEGASRVFRRAGSRGDTAIDATRGGPYRTRPDSMESVVEHATGTKAAPGVGAKLRDALEEAQSAVTGAEVDTLKKYGATRWDDTARTGRRLWRERDQIIDGAARDITEHVDTIARRARVVTDEVVDIGLKKENVRKLLSGDEARMVGEARAEISRMRQGLDDAAGQLDEFGNANFIKRSRKFLKRLEDQAATTDDAAEAFIALDRAKRGMQRDRVYLGRSAIRQQSAEGARAAKQAGNLYEKLSESGRQNLMREDIWGEAAAGAQRKINAGWEDLLEANRFFERNFLVTTGEGFDAARTLRADPKRIYAYVENLGSAKGALVDEHFRKNITATKRLVDAIDEAYDLGTKRADVTAVREAADTIEAALAKADETVRVANQIDEVIKKESASAAPATLLGGALAGPVGLAVGAAYSAVTRPGALIKSAAAIDDLARHVDSKIGRSVSGFFSHAKAKGAATVPGAKLPKLPKVRRALGPSAATFAGENETERKAYKKRVREIVEVAKNPAVLTDRLAKATEGIAHAPKFASSIAMGAQRGAMFLASKVPSGSKLVNPLFPAGDDYTPTDDEISKLAAYWQTTMNPLGVLDDLQRGMVTAEQVEALGAVYPDLLNDIRAKVTEQILDLTEPLPYAARSQLDLLLGLNGAGEPSLSPKFLATWSGAMTADAEPAQKPAKRPVDTESPAAFNTLSDSLEL